MKARVSTQMMIGFLLVFLVCPTNVMAKGIDKGPGRVADLESLPDFFSVQFTGTDRIFHLARTRGGYDVQSSDGTFSAFLDESELSRVRTFPAKKIVGGAYYSRFTIEDGSGASLPYGSIIQWKGSDTMDVSVTLPDGTPLDMSISTPSSAKLMQEEVSTKAVIIIITGAAVLLCWVGSWIVDCGSECSGACGQQGVESFDEGLCGTSCSCECNVT